MKKNADVAEQGDGSRALVYLRGLDKPHPAEDSYSLEDLNQTAGRALTDGKPVLWLVGWPLPPVILHRTSQVAGSNFSTRSMEATIGNDYKL